MAEVTLTVHTDSLLDLPRGASYHARSGRASVEVSKGKEPGTITVYASCDSLQRLVCHYERLAGAYKARLERELEERQDEKKPPDSRRKIWTAFAGGVIAGIVITFKIKRRNE